MSKEKDTSRIRSSSISLKTVPLIWLGFRATQLNTGILNFVLIGFLIFTAEDVRDNDIKSHLEPHKLQVQSDNSPANDPLTLEEEGKRDPGGTDYGERPGLATAIQGPH